MTLSFSPGGHAGGGWGLAKRAPSTRCEEVVFRPILAAIVAVLLWPAASRAAELHLRSECRSQGPVVTLGDVAEVIAADSSQAKALAALELFPAPPPGGKRFLSPREIQDLLLARNVSLLEHRLSGASQVVVLGGDGASEPADSQPPSAAIVRRAQERVSEAVTQYLRQQVSEAEPWTVDVTLQDDQARLLAVPVRKMSVRGGTPPWLGVQRFEITTDSADGPGRFEVDAEVTLTPAVVVAARSLPRGAVIRAGDVRLQQGPEDGVVIEATSEAFHAIDEVLGKQTTQTVPAGKVLDRGSIREPILVCRGEVITVYARSAGVCVRTTARAREDGSLGDVIQVESMLDRAAYLARVCGIQEVEVYARPPQAEATARRGSDAAGGGATGGLTRESVTPNLALREKR
jgi:flagella basal body P-ring formation protein FlgA